LLSLARHNVNPSVIGLTPDMAGSARGNRGARPVKLRVFQLSNGKCRNLPELGKLERKIFLFPSR